MVNGLHLYSAFIQSAVQFMPLIHPFIHQRQLAVMQGTNQLIRSNWGLGVLLRDTSTRPGWDQTGNPPTARRQLLPPEPHRPRCGPSDKGSVRLCMRFLSPKCVLLRRRSAGGALISSPPMGNRFLLPSLLPQNLNQPQFCMLHP